MSTCPVLLLLQLEPTHMLVIFSFDLLKLVLRCGHFCHLFLRCGQPHVGQEEAGLEVVTVALTGAGLLFQCDKTN